MTSIIMLFVLFGLVSMGVIAHRIREKRRMLKAYRVVENRVKDLCQDREFIELCKEYNRACRKD